MGKIFRLYLCISVFVSFELNQRALNETSGFRSWILNILIVPVKIIGYIAAVYLLMMSSCFYKSDKTGTADDVTQSFICRTPGTDYLITHEEVYHATSKSSGGGISTTTGYANYRYTVFNLKTGEQTARVITGDRNEDILALGFDGKKIWCYGADKKMGVHARDPLTFNVAVSRQQVENANPELSNRLSGPSINEAQQYYLYDAFNNEIILTDQQGIIYSLDPASLKTETIPEKPRVLSSFSDPTSTNAYISIDENISLRGDTRQHLELSNDIKSSDNFLKAEFLLEQNKNRLGDIARQLEKTANQKLQHFEMRYDSLLNTYPLLSDQSKAYLSYHDSRMVNDFYDLKRDIENMKRDSANKLFSRRSNLSSMILGCDSNTIYIVHANNLTDTSTLLISKIRFQNRGFSTAWTTLIPQIYFNPDKGIKSDPMADVFKSGSPEFRYEWYGTEGNILCGIKMLFAFALDTETGKLLWKKQL